MPRKPRILSSKFDILPRKIQFCQILSLFIFIENLNYYRHPLGCNDIVQVKSQVSYIRNSYFLNLSNGAIVSQQTNQYADITIEACIFSRVFTNSGNGGAVLIESVGKVIQRKILSDMCYTTTENSRGQYCFVYPKSWHSLPNEIHEISIKGFDEYFKVWEAMALDCGSIIISKINISQHHLLARIYGIYLIAKNSSISYCNIAYNNVYNSLGLVHDPPQKNSDAYFLSKCNVNNNSVKVDGLIFAHSDLFVADCNIVGNDGWIVFFSYYQNSRIFVSDCYINNPNSKASYNANINYSNTLIDEFEIDLRTDTYICAVRFCSHAEQCFYLYHFLMLAIYPFIILEL